MENPTTNIKQQSGIRRIFAFNVFVAEKRTGDVEMKLTKGTRANKTRRKTEKQHLGKIRTKRSKCWTFGFSLLIITLILNIAIAITMWCTNMYYDSIYKILSLHEDGYIFGIWKDPSVGRLISIYPFNYTNYKAVRKGTEVPHVEQLGPYVFREYTTRDLVEFHGNGTLSFQENRTHEFVPELSTGSLSDGIVLPNFPVLAAHNLDDSNILERGGVSLLKLATMPEDFLKLKVEEIIWGYDDRFALVSRTLKQVLASSDKNMGKFGILSMRKGLSPDRITLGTGVPDPDNLSSIKRYNGKDTIGAWKDRECDRIDGTDVSIFPRKLIVRNTTLQIFSKDLCRKLPMVYEQDIKTEEGIPAYRYVMPGDVFSYGDENPENKCFCKNSVCPPSGTFNTAPCHFRIPLFFSYPHFTHADPILRVKVTGLEPDPDKYQTFIDIHELGITVNGLTKLQLNFFIDKSSNTPWLKVKDGTVLPFGWLDMKMGKLTPFLQMLLFIVSYIVPLIDYTLRYGSLLIILTFPMLIYCMLKCGKYKEITLQ